MTIWKSNTDTDFSSSDYILGPHITQSQSVFYPNLSGFSKLWRHGDSSYVNTGIETNS